MASIVSSSVIYPVPSNIVADLPELYIGWCAFPHFSPILGSPCQHFIWVPDPGQTLLGSSCGHPSGLSSKFFKQFFLNQDLVKHSLLAENGWNAVKVIQRIGRSTHMRPDTYMTWKVLTWQVFTNMLCRLSTYSNRSLVQICQLIRQEPVHMGAWRLHSNVCF